MKIGVLDVGGGFRGIYATGVLDYCQDNGIEFDLAMVISAGSANLASFVARQRGRNHKFYTEYAFRKEYAKQGKLIIVSPDDACGVDMLHKDKPSLQKLYDKGYADGQAIKGFLQQKCLIK